MLKALFFVNTINEFLELTVMNVTKQDIEIMSYNSQSIQQCVCGSIEDHIAETVDMYHKRCSKWCEVCKNELVGNRQEDLVPKQATCKNCGKKKGFKFTDDSGVEDAERNEHEMYAKGKASLLQEDQEVEVLDDYESEIAEKTQIPENNPEVKSALVKQIFTIEPKDGFDSSGFVENDYSHNNMVQQSCYAHVINVGNTPHMQKKLPIDEVISIRKSISKAAINIWEEKTYGDAKINAKCKDIMGFAVECHNTGNRKLSDQQVERAITACVFAEKAINKILERNVNRKMSKKDDKELKRQHLIIDTKIAVLKTGNASSGHQSPMYETKINDYDPVSFEKLALELDIPWTEKVMDLHEVAKRVEEENRNAWRSNYAIPEI